MCMLSVCVCACVWRERGGGEEGGRRCRLTAGGRTCRSSCNCSSRWICTSSSFCCVCVGVWVCVRVPACVRVYTIHMHGNAMPERERARAERERKHLNGAEPIPFIPHGFQPRPSHVSRGSRTSPRVPAQVFLCTCIHMTAVGHAQIGPYSYVVTLIVLYSFLPIAL